MAHSRQAQKRVRQDEERNARNRAQRSHVRTVVKKLEQVIAAGEREEIGMSFKATMAALQRASRKGLMSKGAASRKISRLAARIRRVSAPAN
jgi:small subunit ribosomal protein S20